MTRMKTSHILKDIDQNSRKYDSCYGTFQGILKRDLSPALGNILMQMAKLPGSKSPFLFNAQHLEEGPV